jgi:hypothetical protein
MDFGGLLMFGSIFGLNLYQFWVDIGKEMMKS